MFLKEQLSQYDGTTEMVESCLDLVRESEKVIIFGAGVGGAALYHFLEKNKLTEKVISWSDNNELKHGKTYFEDRLEIVNPEKLFERFGKNVLIIVASSAFDIIQKQLISYGFNEDQVVLFNFAFMDLDYTDRSFIWDHMDDFERAYARMSDEKSRRIFVNILNYKITKQGKYLLELQKDVDDENYQYFDRDLYSKDIGECFLDIGAYTGDTLKVFLDVYEKGFRKYYGFEADDVVFEKLKKVAEKSSVNEKIQLYNFAAWDEETILYFEENAGSSKMEEENNGSKTGVKAMRVEDVLKENPVSIVKMDIEGAEYKAMCGLKSIIERDKPILAICVYHKRDDYYKLTDLIEEILPNEYKFFFRQYRYTPTETVCYAIPKAR